MKSLYHLNSVMETANRSRLKRLLSKATICLVLLFFITSICNAQDKKTDWEKDEVKGKVKSIETKHYMAVDKSGSIGKGIELTNDDLYMMQDTASLLYPYTYTTYDYILAKYNSNGYITERIYSDRRDGGTFIQTNVIEYNNKYNAIKIYSEDSLTHENGKDVWNVVIKYNDNGQATEESYYRSDESLDRKYTYKYDEKGNKIEDNRYYSDGNLYNKYIYKYDDKGNKIETSEYYSNESLSNKYIYKYDEKGNIVKTSECRSDDSLRDTYICKYDEKGNKVEEIFYRSDGSLYETCIYKYDEKGNIVVENIFYPDVNFYHKYIYKYDENGILTKYNEYEYDYKYDKQGNWIERITYEGDARIPKFITERTIEYYK